MAHFILDSFILGETNQLDCDIQEKIAGEADTWYAFRKGENDETNVRFLGRREEKHANEAETELFECLHRNSENRI